MIPVNTPLLQGNEKQYLLECIDTGWISSEGPFIARFEAGMARMCNRKHGVAASNGSAALDIAIKALGISHGDEVLMPAFTIISPASSIVTQGAIPVLVDSNPDTWNMEVAAMEAKITPKTKAILVVHIYGLPVDMNPILKLAEKYGLLVIEDAAEMHGQTYNGAPCGSFGDISIFSFYPNKHITTGEGGMLMTNNDALAEKCRQLRNLCFVPPKRFIHYELGWNYRMTNMQAALGVAQLEQLDKFVTKKRMMGAFYNERFDDLKELGVQLPLQEVSYAKNIYWIYGMILPEGRVKADQIQEKLGEKQIGTRPFFYPMHQQPVFKNMGLFENESYPIAERMYDYGFYIPSGLGLTEIEMNEVANQVISTIHECL